MASIYTTAVGPRIDAIPDAIMEPYQKAFARETVVSVIEIAKAPIDPMFATQKADLIYAMKAASLEGFQLASFVTVGAAMACAIAVALFLPWRPVEGDGVLLAWRGSDDQDKVS